MILRLFGIGTAKAFAGCTAQGTVTRVDTCYWFRVNTKPVRRYSGDGAVYPHIIHFTYCAGDLVCTGKRWVHWNRRCPVKGEPITVHYEESSPEKYAVMV